MKAVVCDQYGPAETLQFKDVESPTAGTGQLLIDVKAAGCNFPDALVIQGLYQIKVEPPFSPGGEGAGVITAVGEGVDDFSVGDRVLFYSLCGAFAEQIVISAANAVPIPDVMPYDIAAGFLAAYGTAYHALKQKANLRAGENVLILGASGGLGSAAIQVAKAMGANVIACASSDEKLAVCKSLGADYLVNYMSEDLKTAIRGKTGRSDVDVIFDPVGGDFSERAFRTIAVEGRFLVIGFTAGIIAKIALNLPLLKEASIVGVFWNSWIMREPDQHHKNMAELYALYLEGKVSPLISATFPLVAYERAFACLSERRAVGKIILTI
jgi:NADPH2:quinone reductase